MAPHDGYSTFGRWLVRRSKPVRWAFCLAIFPVHLAMELWDNLPRAVENWRMDTRDIITPRKPKETR